MKTRSVDCDNNDVADCHGRIKSAIRVSQFPRRQRVDSCVSRRSSDTAQGPVGSLVLNDPERVLVGSDMLRLEIMPKALYFGRDVESRFYSSYFELLDTLVPTTPQLVVTAEELAMGSGLAAMDALLVAAAKEAKADEFITFEKPDKPMFRVEGISIVSLAA